MRNEIKIINLYRVFVVCVCAVSAGVEVKVKKKNENYFLWKSFKCGRELAHSPHVSPHQAVDVSVVSPFFLDRCAVSMRRRAKCSMENSHRSEQELKF